MRSKQAVLAASAVLVVGALAAFGCVPQAQSPKADPAEADAAEAQTQVAGVPETGLRPLADWQVDPSMPEEDFLGAIYGAYDDRSEEYPTPVIEFDDGTTAMRTPHPARDSTANVRDYIAFNTYRLNAENRGCWACHDDLADTVANMGDAAHTDLHSTLGMELTVDQCIDCHVLHLGGKYESNFSGLMHNIHGSQNKLFAEKGGDCWSCHYGVVDEGQWGTATPDEGGMQLWDQVKHNVLRGIDTLAADKFSGDFTTDQNVVQGADDEVWSYTYVRKRDNDESAVRFARERKGLVPDPAADGIYDEWTVTLNDQDGRAVTYTINELMDVVEPETVIMSQQCQNNGENGSYITNREVTGFPIEKLAELVGAENRSLVKVTASDTREVEFGLDHVKEYGGYLVFEISGEPISYASGYPLQIWLGGWLADENNKGVTDITFTDDVWKPALWRGGSVAEKDGNAGYSPNVGIKLHEGQIINVNEPFTFEGYASTFIHKLTDIEVSMDHGKTWQTFETPDNDPSKWTWWTFTYTPDKVGSYCIMVRGHDDAGHETPEPAEIMFNVVDPSEAK